LQVLIDPVEKAFGCQPFLVGADQKREILSHVARLNRIDANLFERRREAREVRVVVELGAVGEAARPGGNPAALSRLASSTEIICFLPGSLLAL